MTLCNTMAEYRYSHEKHTVLCIWDEFVTYFSSVMVACEAKHRHKIGQLANILRDTQKRLYYIFVLPLVNKFEKLKFYVLTIKR